MKNVKEFRLQVTYLKSETEKAPKSVEKELLNTILDALIELCRAIERDFDKIKLDEDNTK